MQGISWLAEDLLGSREGPCSVEWVSQSWDLKVTSLIIMRGEEAEQVISCATDWYCTLHSISYDISVHASPDRPHAWQKGTGWNGPGSLQFCLEMRCCSNGSLCYQALSYNTFEPWETCICPLNLPYGAGTYGKIWPTCRQHEIQ